MTGASSKISTCLTWFTSTRRNSPFLWVCMRCILRVLIQKCVPIRTSFFQFTKRISCDQRITSNFENFNYRESTLGGKLRKSPTSKIQIFDKKTSHHFYLKFIYLKVIWKFAGMLMHHCLFLRLHSLQSTVTLTTWPHLLRRTLQTFDNTVKL